MVKKKHVEGHISRGNPFKVKIVESGAESRTCIRIRDSREPSLEPRVRRRSQRRETSSAMPDTWFWGWTPCSFTWRYLGAGHQVSVASAEVVWRDFLTSSWLSASLWSSSFSSLLLLLLSLSLVLLSLLFLYYHCRCRQYGYHIDLNHLNPFTPKFKKFLCPNLSKRRMYKWGSEIW